MPRSLSGVRGCCRSVRRGPCGGRPVHDGIEPIFVLEVAADFSDASGLRGLRGPPTVLAGGELRWFLVESLELRDAGDAAAVWSDGARPALAYGLPELEV